MKGARSITILGSLFFRQARMVSNLAQLATSNNSHNSITRNPKLHLLRAVKIITEYADDQALSKTAMDAYIRACQSILQNVNKKLKARDFDGVLKITASAKETFKQTDILPTEAKKILCEILYIRGACLLSGPYDGIETTEEAARSFEKAVQCNPEHTEAAAALEHLKGRLAFKRGEVKAMYEFRENENGDIVYAKYEFEPPPTPPKNGMK